ncbi:MAG TPA: glycosyltransferase family 2 protein [Gemmatimonadaceae bacterium]
MPSSPAAPAMDALLPDLGIVVPAHNEYDNVPAMYEALARVLDPAGIRFELLFVDDGSRDGTAEAIRRLAAANARVRALILSRNFGHQAAVSIGLQHARGRAVAVMDGDLQDRPEDLVNLYRRWEQGADVVYAVRGTRPEGIFLKAAYKLFYRILAKTARIPIPLDSGDFCVMDARFVERLNALPERLRFVRGLRAWLGGTQVGVTVERGERHAGESKYTLRRLMRLATDGIFSFSDAPLRMASILGVVVSVGSLLGFVVVLAWRLMGLIPTGAGLATIALSVLFLGGVQLLTIGVLGEYISRIFDEVKARPVAVVQELVEGGPPRA